jgi:probable rRNA maturation factor
MYPDLDLEIQRIYDSGTEPEDALLRLWSQAALADRRAVAELVIRIVDEAEITELNSDYRGKDKPTNVLSFPCEAPPELPAELAAELIGDQIGDLVICAPVVQGEALEQGKSVEAHWAHMVVHGVLHLLGYDHVKDADALVMENLERDIMQGLGFPDPYHEADGAVD